MLLFLSPTPSLHAQTLGLCFLYYIFGHHRFFSTLHIPVRPSIQLQLCNGGFKTLMASTLHSSLFLIGLLVLSTPESIASSSASPKNMPVTR